MSLCRTCLAPVTWAVDAEGNRIPLDDHEQLDYGPKRYRIVTDGVVPQVQPVAEDSTARVFVDHRHLCQQPRAI